MHIEFLVEDLSTEAALELLVPKIVDVGTSFATHVFGSKSTLLAKLEARLRSYSHWLPPTWRIIVVVDEDRADCRAIKKKLESASRAATLKTKGAAKGKPFSILNRIAIEELEAWFFGDVPAIGAAYPGVPLTLASKARYRDSDAIGGGTWEALERVLQGAGHHLGGLQKIRAAREIATFMNPSLNTSKSFRVFRDGLLAL